MSFRNDPVDSVKPTKDYTYACDAMMFLNLILGSAVVRAETVTGELGVGSTVPRPS